jgi:HK97 family phage prohead protease
MQMTVEEDGLHIRVNLDVENNSDARSLYSAVERGDIDGMSFMFVVDGELWEEEESDHPKRTITDIEKVFEVSAVTFPAYEQTSISARGLADALESAKASLESVRAEKRAIENKKKKIKILSQM